jgi:hypothetical protein
LFLAILDPFFTLAGKSKSSWNFWTARWDPHPEFDRVDTLQTIGYHPLWHDVPQIRGKDPDMQINLLSVRRVAIVMILLPLLMGLGEASLIQAKTTEGFGKLKLGMTPSEVEALEGCTTNTTCLYDLLGKNRYFTLSYGENDSTRNVEVSPGATTTLRQIDIDMGNHTNEWFGELYEALASQYQVFYVPTETEDSRFQEGKDHELLVGFADGSVLLKIVRRPYGNLILRVVYQNEEAAKALREYWIQNHPNAIPK